MQKYKILEMQLAAQTNTQLLHLKVPPAGRSGRKSEDIWFHTLNTLSTQHSTKASFFAQSHLLKRLILCNPKQGQKFVVPTFYIHFLNPECVRIPWVLAPKNFPVENFRVRSVLQKSSIFHWFLLPPTKIKYQARVPTILMPQTFPIASLNRYTPNFSGVPHKLT